MVRRWLGAVALLMLVASSCGASRPVLEGDDDGISREVDESTTTTTSPAVAQGALRVAVQDVWTGDPADAGPASLGRRVLADLLFDGVTALDGGGNVVPALAESWTVSEDRLTWTFVIDADATDTTGAQVTARTIMQSLNRVAGRGEGDVVAGSLTAISGWTDRMAGLAGGAAGITAPEPGLLVIRLDQPFEPLLEVLASPALGVAAAGDEGLVGTGPYRMEANGTTIVGVDPDEALRPIELVDTAGADWAVLPPTITGDVLRVPLDLELAVIVRLDEAAQRRSVAGAIDTIALARVADASAVPPLVVSGERGEAPSVTVDVPDGPLVGLGDAIAGQLIAAGIGADVVVSDPEAFAQRVATGKAKVFPMVIAGGQWSGGALVDALTPGGSGDLIGIESTPRRAAIEGIVAELDPSVRATLLDALRQVAVDEAVLIPVGRFDARVSVSAAGEGLRHRPDGTLDLDAAPTQTAP